MPVSSIENSIGSIVTRYKMSINTPICRARVTFTTVAGSKVGQITELYVAVETVLCIASGTAF